MRVIMEEDEGEDEEEDDDDNDNDNDNNDDGEETGLLDTMRITIICPPLCPSQISDY